MSAEIWGIALRRLPAVPVRLLLDRLEASERSEDMNLPGFDFHALKGFDPIRYTVHVNGPWRITFELDGKDAARVDFEQYH
ncbi:type II toxin-antitoxin system RelE/ParE family toxin [Mesorhizobium sp. VK24D]|uniref:Type II toxin-antitoxin system RelE/ParE family toxin n=1 Tax=Mesorhizobium album TaxID=3072314 RepID=A0ABU4Y3H1_9HYPH|nr:type II toxin-antitoxin system RelE/ParE family toxin [Mesorhizobium sp. VK24D]MDX8480457.1 type II toxin-antitoxin system RelE/ParE family toxin [Mesorhizobium sp. VK24D]